MATEPRLWLKKEVTTNEQGHPKLDGDCGTERIVVVLDPSITKAVPPENRETAILAMHQRIQNAARRKHAARESYPVFPPNRAPHKLIALTEEDLSEA